MFDFKVTTPLDFLWICIGATALLWGVSTLIPDILKFITELLKILWGEFKLGRKKSAIEIIDAFFVIGFLILSILCCLLEKAPSAMTQAFGNSGAQDSSSQCFFYCIVFLFVSLFVSPLWIFLDRHEASVRALVKRALKK